jgi:hypothetical protein
MAIKENQDLISSAGSEIHFFQQLGPVATIDGWFGNLSKSPALYFHLLIVILF